MLIAARYILRMQGWALVGPFLLCGIMLMFVGLEMIAIICLLPSRYQVLRAKVRLRRVSRIQRKLHLG